MRAFREPPFTTLFFSFLGGCLDSLPTSITSIICRRLNTYGYLTYVDTDTVLCMYVCTLQYYILTKYSQSASFIYFYFF